eukprot:GILJ01002757.1.p1 GENE.GILJ01002757.1~~GILJ01002757.1.p1  ORF type:complete len:195 (+),score=17.68 GILJ01002757.1:52-636(+)
MGRLEFPSLSSLQKSLRNAPKQLLLLCIVQAVVVLCSVSLKFFAPRCVLSHGDGVEFISCNHIQGLSLKDGIIVICVLAVISFGLRASRSRDKKLLQWYGTGMIAIAVVTGYIAILAVTVEAAQIQYWKTLPVSYQNHREILDMLSATQMYAIWFGLNCLLASIGALFAFKTKEHFDYEEIQERHTTSWNSAVL